MSSQSSTPPIRNGGMIPTSSVSTPISMPLQNLITNRDSNSPYNFIEGGNVIGNPFLQQAVPLSMAQASNWPIFPTGFPSNLWLQNNLMANLSNVTDNWHSNRLQQQQQQEQQQQQQQQPDFLQPINSNRNDQNSDFSENRRHPSQYRHNNPNEVNFLDQEQAQEFVSNMVAFASRRAASHQLLGAPPPAHGGHQQQTQSLVTSIQSQLPAVESIWHR